MVKQRHQLCVAFLVFLDAAVIAAACYGAWILRTLVRVRMAGGWWPQSWENYFKEPLIFFVVPLAIFCMWACGLYRPRRDRSLWNEQVQLAKAVGIALMLLLVVWVAGIALLGALFSFFLVRRSDRVKEGRIFVRRSRWVTSNTGRTPAITKHPPPDD